MTRWFRFYHEALNDPKVQSLEPELFKHWVNLLCIASQHDGYLPEICNVSFLLRVTVSDVTCIIEALQGHGLIDVSSNQHAANYKMHGWDKRQYKSDSSAERVRQHRKRKRNVTVTPPDTDTDTDNSIHVGNGVSDASLAESKIGKYTSEFEGFWSSFPETKGTSKKDAFGAWKKLSADDRKQAAEMVSAYRQSIEGKDHRAIHAVRYLKQRRFETLADSNPIQSEAARQADEEIAASMGITVEELRR